MSDTREQVGAGAMTQDGPSESTTQARPSESRAQAQLSEEDMRTAYEAELNRISSSEMILQTAVSLLNIGGRRLGLAPPAAAGAPSTAAQSERDLEQVRDAIDGASALMPILERRMPGELGPLRNAIAQLQVAYAREAKGSAGMSSAAASSATQSPRPEQGASSEQPEQAQPAAEPEQPASGDRQPGPGPAQASGRLWVPGR
jgi:hypothetical protein